MKILLTSFGSFSGPCIAKSLKDNFNATIVAIDINDEPYLTGTEYIDTFIKAPHSRNSHDYLDFLKATILNKEINYVLPLTDLEVDLLARSDNLTSETNTIICMPNTRTIHLCRDKSLWACILKEKGFNTIPTINRGDLIKPTLPIVAKPKNGRSSQGFMKLNDTKSVAALVENKHFDNYILQPYISGKNYVVDAVRDFYGNCITVCREEITRTSNGAGLSVLVRENEELSLITERILAELNIHGAINIEYLESEGIYYAMDINPRPSAGIEFSVLSGVDIPKHHIECFQRKKLPLDLSYPSKMYKTIYQRVAS